MASDGRHGLPLPVGYDDDETYVNELLSFVTLSSLWQTLVTSVHIVDFFTSDPDVYDTLLDHTWQSWFELHDIDTLLDLFIREDIDTLVNDRQQVPLWREKPPPPASLLDFLASIRKLSLNRNCQGYKPPLQISKQVSVGMKSKKIHEVSSTAQYVQQLTMQLKEQDQHSITHLVDFGAGQGYLGRFLACEPMNRHVIAVEGKDSNVHVAKAMDVSVKLATKPKTMRNKKEYRQDRTAKKRAGEALPPAWRATRYNAVLAEPPNPSPSTANPEIVHDSYLATSVAGRGSIHHVQHQLQDGNLRSIISGITAAGRDVGTSPDNRGNRSSSDRYVRETVYQENVFDTHHENPRLLVMSLHSCGNLSHHAIRSLVINPEVKAVAVIGCCYNRLSERLRPPSFKAEYLRPSMQPGSGEDSLRHGDAQGFPMSNRFCTHESPLGNGISFSITARMMAVQAPANWSSAEANSYFTRHFFRALLQRILLDCGIVDPPIPQDQQHTTPGIISAGSPAGGGGSLQPIIIGKLSNGAYDDFATYGGAATERIRSSHTLNEDKMSMLAGIDVNVLSDYERRFSHRKKHISIIWTLMALSATLVEAMIVVDRWLWLKEQNEVDRCWVEPIFDYHRSPRNLIVVGIKRN